MIRNFSKWNESCMHSLFFVVVVVGFVPLHVDLVQQGHDPSPLPSADYADLEGATGFTPPMEVPAWVDPQEEEHEDELHEVRRRRLQRFSQDSRRDNTDNIDLD